MSYLARQDVMLVGGAVVIIVIAIAIASSLQGGSESFSQIQTYGPVWSNPIWTCTSDKDFIVHGVLRGLATGQLTIRISGLGTQGLYDFTPGNIEPFTVGAMGGETITLSREGTVSGWITLQTMSGAMASCTNG